MEIEVLAMDRLSSVLASPPFTDSEPSSPLAINVYSALAKLHRHSLIPYLPRIMSSVLSSLSSSSQLHLACTQVVSALAMHTIDSSRDPVSNEDTLRSLCRPLLSSLLSLHPPHLSAGAASCLQSLVESSPWRCAPLDLQELVCAKGMQGLLNESIQTVAHMDLMRALSRTSSCVVIQGYGAQLLAAGMDILQNSNNSMKRVAAAKLLESLLKIADAELLDLNISPIVGVLQGCQQDKFVTVRTAAADALKTASTYGSIENSSYRQQLPGITEKRMRQGFQKMPRNAQKKSPATISPATAPLPDTPAATSPSPINSDSKWLRRLPLAPLQQFSRSNSNFAATKRKQQVPSRFSKCKENVAPAYINGVPTASRYTQPRKSSFSKKDASSLWPQSPSVISKVENWGLFDSPHTPIVPFRGETEFDERNSSVTALLEKNFGKQRLFWEDEIDASAANVLSNVIITSKGIICDQDEASCNEGNSCKSVNQESDQSSLTRSNGTDLCCGTEEIYSPDKESSSDCESSMTSAHSSTVQNQTSSGHLMMTPRRLVRILQFDDELQTHLQQDMRFELNVGMLDDADSGVAGSGQCENGHYYDELDSNSIPSECKPGSEHLAVSKEDTQENTSSIDITSLVKQHIWCNKAALVMNKVGTFELTCSGIANLKELAGDDHEISHNKPNVDLRRSVLSLPKHVCLKLQSNFCFVFMLVICVGLFIAGLAIYMESCKALIGLVPT